MPLLSDILNSQYIIVKRFIVCHYFLAAPATTCVAFIGLGSSINAFCVLFLLSETFKT